MKRTTPFLLIALCAGLPLPVFAQRAAAGQTPISPHVAADPNDVSSPDAIIAALYDANSNLVDRKIGADRFRSLVVPGAQFSATARRGNTGLAVLNSRTTEQYIQVASAGPPRHGFSEREIKRTSEAFGHIVQAFSTYQTFRDSTDKNPVHGINSIQLFHDGQRWWIVSVLWDIEAPGNPIPAIYKPE